MNTNKGFFEGILGIHGIKKYLLLVASAFLFSMPFVTKSFVSVNEVSSFASIFGWCGLSVLFITVFDFQKTLKRVLCSLFLFFFVFYLLVYSWFVNLYPLDFAGLGNVESIGIIIIALTAIPVLHSFFMTAGLLFGYFAAKYVKINAFRCILVSFGYVLGEYMQSIGVFAFPWARLFVGQTAFPSLLQSASFFGSYFVTFVIVLVNSLLAMCIVEGNRNRKKGMMYFLCAIAVFLVNLGFGIVRINTVDFSDSKKISCIVLQGNIPSGEKWSGNVDEIQVYSDLAESIAAENKTKKIDADIAVMPETAFPVTLYTEDAYTSYEERVLENISKMLDVELFAGAFGYEDGKTYNSIFLIDKDGLVSKPYNKRNIVPFGEYLPYRNIVEKIAPSLGKINMISSDISKGESFYPIEAQKGRAACLVCFDSIFPDTARKQIKNGGEFIVIATNDSWYKDSCAIYQHADHAVMRAIENNVPVIRSANTGISRIIDSRGRVIAQTNVNEKTALSASVYFTGNMSLYTRIGDSFVLLCMVVIVTVYAFVTIKKAFRINRKANM